MCCWNLIAYNVTTVHSYCDNSGYFSIASYDYGELQISSRGKSGPLEFYNGSNWGAICTNGFNDDAGDVACKQLGYRGSSVVYDYG